MEYEQCPVCKHIMDEGSSECRRCSGESKPRWTKAERRMPPPGKPVLCYVPRQDVPFVIATAYQENGEVVWGPLFRKGRHSEITHWKEIQPPEDIPS